MRNLQTFSRFKVDPTRSIVLRRAFEADVKRRLRKLKQDIVQLVYRNDAFGLSPSVNVAIPGKNAFRFLRSDNKVGAFMDWLTEAESEGILETSKGTSVTSVGSGAWTDTYIETAYKKGVAASGSKLKQQGFEISDTYVTSAFNRPVHADRAGLSFTRAFSELEGITAAMDQQISRVLAQGLAEGKGPRQLARELVDRVDKIGVARARMMARTEVVAAHADAALNSYREAGLEGVTAEVEFATAGDNQVCSTCEALDEQVFSLAEAQGMIPVHPNCRCSWLPVVK